MKLMKTLNIKHIHTSRYITVCTELHSIKLRDDIFTGHFVLSQIPRLVMSIVLSSAYICMYIYIYGPAISNSWVRCERPMPLYVARSVLSLLIVLFPCRNHLGGLHA